MTMQAVDPNGYLMAFEDGPLSTMGNVPTLAGSARGRFVVPRGLFGWPLPDRVAIQFVGKGDERQVLISDTAKGGVDEAEVDAIYVKESESQLPDDSSDRVMRGAGYRVEA